jgi:hypothetical protein
VWVTPTRLIKEVLAVIGTACFLIVSASCSVMGCLVVTGWVEITRLIMKVPTVI